MTNLIDTCFHGRLDRRVAEERLSTDGRQGAFLLRESDRKTGSYVLSYNGRIGVNHFKITNAYGSYFIGGRQFDSLSDLINYYSNSCDLLTDERLLYPVSPPETVAAKRRIFRSILPYTKLANSDELSFKKGDVFLLLNDLGDNWLWVRDVRTGQSGMVFSQLLEELHGDSEPNEVFPWFHAKLGKSDAVSKLAEAGPGSFLMRPSDNSPGNYTLFYHVGTTIQRFLIVRDSENRYIMGGKCFDSLGQIVDLYQREQVIEGHVLRFPVTTTLSRNDRPSESSLTSRDRISKETEDIYNTVKMSREAAKQKQSSEVVGWLSLKKDDIQKKWKNYYFVLNSRDRHLYYYEKSQQAKPKGLIDLSYSSFYHVHDSLFDWSQCFLLVEKCLPCFTNRFYLRCNDDPPDFERWHKAILNFTTTEQCNKRRVTTSIDSTTFDARSKWTGSRSNDVYEERRSIYLSLITAQSLKISHPYFLISYNQDINIAKTSVKTTPTAVFSEDSYFAFDCLPSDVKSITVSLQQNKKVKSAMEAPQFTIDLTCLRPEGESFDRWFKLCAASSNESSGCLRMRVIYDRDIIMSISDYAALEDLLCEMDQDLVALFNQFRRRDHITLARSIVNILKYKQLSVRTLKSLLEREVDLENDVTSLFRTNSLVLALIESYIRSMSRDMLNKCLKVPVKKLLDDRICCEINPSKLESHNDSQRACENFQNLLDVLNELVANIYESIEYYSLPVRYLLSCLQRKVMKKWPDEQLIRTRVISSFIILRLICPILLNPKQFKLINETPSENAFRNLTLVAKCLQSLSNLVETSKSNSSLAQSIINTLDDYSIYSKDEVKVDENDDYSTQTNSILAFILSPQIESWMDVVNPFILKNKIGMIKFVDELCNIEPVDPILFDQPFKHKENDSMSERNYPNDEITNPAQDFAIIHSTCEKYRGELEDQASISAPAKKLTAVLTILSKHKQYYVNLKRNTHQKVQNLIV